MTRRGPATRAARQWVSSAVWVQVVTAAEGRCEHVDSAGRRCEHTSGVYPLVAAPRDASVRPEAAYRCPVGELAAWCAEHLDEARARAEKERQALAAVERTGDLFAECDLVVTGTSNSTRGVIPMNARTRQVRKAGAL